MCTLYEITQLTLNEVNLKAEFVGSKALGKSEVVNVAAVVEGRIWLGSSGVRMMQIGSMSKSFFCREGAKTSLTLEAVEDRSYVSRLSEFFKGPTTQVTIIKDMPGLKLVAVYTSNLSKLDDSELSFYDRTTALKCGALKLGWIKMEIASFMEQQSSLLSEADIYSVHEEP